jgi:hypothetical protein
MGQIKRDCLGTVLGCFNTLRISDGQQVSVVLARVQAHSAHSRPSWIAASSKPLDVCGLSRHPATSSAVGILAAHCAQHRGAKRVILIDNVEYRLQHAQVGELGATRGRRLTVAAARLAGRHECRA